MSDIYDLAVLPTCNTPIGRLLAQGTESDEQSSSFNKRRRRDSDDSSSSSKSAVNTKLPHIDSVYRLELVPAKPEPSAVVIGEPPAGVRLPSTSDIADRVDQRALVQTLIERAQDCHSGNKQAENLFYDLDRLNHSQIKALAELEWEKQLASPVIISPELTYKRSSRKQAAANIALANSEEQERDSEVDLIRRSFCEKTRAMNLASKMNVAW